MASFYVEQEDLTVNETTVGRVLRRSRQTSGPSVHLFLAMLLSLVPECTSAFLVDRCSAIVTPNSNPNFNTT